MSGFLNSPRLLKGGLVLLDAESGAEQRIIALEYNPDTLTRRLESREARSESDHGEAFRLAGLPKETIALKADWKRS